MPTLRLSGMSAFLMVWFGQLVSLLGSAMSRFALLIWVWQRTGEATPTVLISLFVSVPTLLLTPLAGALVDRWSRKWVMVASDLAAGMATVLIFVLYTAGQLQIWHIYLSGAVAGIAGTFQFLAATASTSLLLPKEQYARASGLNSLAEYSALIGAPLLAGLLIGVVGITGILVIDLLTFLFAVSTLVLVPIPQPASSSTGAADHDNLWKNMVYGFHYIFQRPPLRGLLLVLFTFTAAETVAYFLVAPMVLARTGGSESALGLVQAAMGVGGVLGGGLLVIWGGSKRRINTIVIGLVLTGLLGDGLMGLGQSLPVWLAAAFFLEVFIPPIIAANRAIWQTKVAPDVQGRVFAARQMLTNAAEPISIIFGGLLADRVFEPALLPTGSLATTVGAVVGTGPGAGMGLLLLICGIVCALAGLSGYLFGSVRRIDELLPDQNVT